MVSDWPPPGPYFVRFPSAVTTVISPRLSNRSISLPVNAIRELLRALPLALRCGLQLPAGGVDIAAARSPHRGRDPGFENDVRERADAVGLRAFVGRARPRVERDQIDLGRQLV